ncbi:MAG: hypothetical protein KDM81_19005, partial [Verrucomicrobiae bacterium]|nr:hypothetical protein [Verrucomicrobiae bacterium]
MRKSLVAVGLSVLAWVQSQAQPLFAQAESIESTVANADYVIVGKLEKFGETEKAAEREGHAATIAVEETLKEKYARIESQQRLSVRLPDPLSTLVGWKERGCRLLIAIGDCEPRTVTVIDLTDARLEVLTADFAVLRDPEAVIQAAKETVRRMPRAVRRIHTFELGVPGAALVGTRWASKGTLVLNVPADERLEM